MISESIASRRAWLALMAPTIIPALLGAQSASAQSRALVTIEAHRGYVFAAVLFLIAQAALIAALLANRARRRHSEARNNAILRAIPDFMFLQSKDGVYLDYSAKDPAVLFVPPSQFIGRNMREIVPPPLAEIFVASTRRLFDGEEPVIVEYDVPVPSGETQHYEARLVRCENDKFLSIVRDITERRRAETAIRDEQLRLRLATAAGGVGVWDWNLETNEFFADPELKARLGYGDADVRNHVDDWRRLVHAANLADGVDVRALVAGPTSKEFEQRMIHKDGSIRWFLVRGAVERDSRGAPTRVVGTSTDITERKHAAQQLENARAELLRASTLATLGEFAGSVSHELAQPVTAIVANAHALLLLLDRPNVDQSALREAVQEVFTSSKLAREVISHTRQLFSNGDLDKAPCSLADIVNDACVMVHSTLRARNVALDVQIAPNLPRFRGDPVQLRQVVLNLLNNGIQAMEHVGSERPRQLAIRAAVDDVGRPTVTVSDTGIGLANVDSERMFSTAYTTKPDGMGWGLSISRTIVEAHGGKLWAEPNERGGAAFSFTLPLEAATSLAN